MSRRSRNRKPASLASRSGKLLIGVGIALMAFCVLAYFSVMGYLQSDGFRKFLSAKVSDPMHLTGEFSPFRWEGLAVETDSFQGGGEGLITSMKAEGLRTEVGMGGIQRGVWEVKGSSLRRLEISLDAAKALAESNKAPTRARTNRDDPTPAWLPREVELDGLSVQSIHLDARLPQGRVTASGMAAEIEPAGAKNTYRAELSGGELRLPFKHLPALELQKLSLRFQDKQLFLTDSKLRAWERGRIEATGEWDSTNGQYAMEGTVSEIPVEEILDKDWSKHLQGSAKSTFVLENSRNAPTAHGQLSIDQATLTALPILDHLAAYTDTRRFRILNLNEAKSAWRWSHNELILSEMVISSEGLVRLEGTLKIAGAALDGHFRLGLAPGTLAAIPGAETDVFTPGERGLLWAPLRISGTLDAPEEDLSERLIRAAGLRMFDQIPETGEKVIKFTRSLIPENSSKTVDQGLKMIEEGTDVLKEASGILGGFIRGGTSQQAPESEE